MGLLDKLFGIKRSDEYYQRESKSKLSPDGYPICPFCNHQYDVTVKRLKQIAEGQPNPYYICSGCEQLLKF